MVEEDSIQHAAAEVPNTIAPTMEFRLGARQGAAVAGDPAATLPPTQDYNASGALNAPQQLSLIHI